MCCFSLPVTYVGNTSIYARREGERQWLAYQMELETVEEVAMVLPLPVPPDPGEEAVRFHDLSAYDDLFADLDRAWPQRYEPLARAAGAMLPQTASTLRVHAVGDFDASFVPSPRDFARLDPRFRLDEAVLDQLPQYADWGFAVFELAQRARPGLLRRLLGRTGAWRRAVNPMAFSFPTRDPRRTFFPTVHVHDGEVPAQARFDHSLYLQREPRVPHEPDPDPAVWEREHAPIASVVDLERAGGLLGEQPCFRAWVRGHHANVDTWV